MSYNLRAIDDTSSPDVRIVLSPMLKCWRLFEPDYWTCYCRLVLASTSRSLDYFPSVSHVRSLSQSNGIAPSPYWVCSRRCSIARRDLLCVWNRDLSVRALWPSSDRYHDSCVFPVLVLDSRSPKPSVRRRSSPVVLGLTARSAWRCRRVELSAVGPGDAPNSCSTWIHIVNCIEANKQIFIRSIRTSVVAYLSLRNRWNSSMAIAPFFTFVDNTSKPRLPSPQNVSPQRTIGNNTIWNVQGEFLCSSSRTNKNREHLLSLALFQQSNSPYVRHLSSNYRRRQWRSGPKQNSSGQVENDCNFSVTHCAHHCWTHGRK